MREIKFRCWSESKKGWQYFTGIYNMPDSDYVGADYQFTGLHDKNGKEIYEGDLIKNTVNEIEEVIWSDYLGAWQMRNGTNPDDSLAHFLKEEPFEVIGNIYSNPELLTPTQGEKEYRDEKEKERY